MNKKKFLNPEKGIEEYYTERLIPELITVKDVDDLIVVNHYWEDSDGELWVDFENPDENLAKAFDAYRSRKGFMTPQELKKLLENLHISVRDFAKNLGISYSVVSQIQNNQRVQTLYQENLFRSAQKEYEEKGVLQNRVKNDYITDLLNESEKTPWNPSNMYSKTQRGSNSFYLNRSLGDVV
jgi:transcriptional regulator with XRE-family HTH domain